MSRLTRLLNSRKPVVADGAMATSLYEKGFYINRSFEELNLTDAQAVRDVSRGFLRAGAQIIHTNTFSANLPKLTQYGLQGQLPGILQQAAKISREVAGEDAAVLGLIGPLSVLIEPLGPTSLEEAEAFFATNVKAFEASDIDGYALYALHDLNEMRAALSAIRKHSTKPVVVCMGIQDNMRSSQGHTIADFVALTDQFNADAIGFCGEVGPSGMLTAIEALRPLTNRPIVALPNAGMPRYVNDQYIYLCSPDYMGKYARRLLQAGANVVGGHCGVYDSHIKAISNAAKMAGDLLAGSAGDYGSASLSGGAAAGSSTSAAEVGGVSDASGADVAPGGNGSDYNDTSLPSAISPIRDEPKDPIALEKRSSLGADLAAGREVLTVELVPPTLGDFGKFLEKCKELENAGIKYVNIPDGARAMARISSLHLAQHVQRNFKLEPVPHFTCRDRNLIGLQSDLLGAHIAGVRNLLLVTGDPPKLGNNPDASAVYDVDSIGLTHILARMNRGLDRGGATSQNQTCFNVGVAVNPTAANIELELRRFQYKVEAGADYAITQPIYDLELFKRFMDKVHGFRRQIPIIMGIWPLVSLRNAEFLKNEVPGVEVPDDVIERMREAGDDKDAALATGLEIAHTTIATARREGLAAGFQISAPFNRVEVALRALRG